MHRLRLVQLAAAGSQARAPPKGRRRRLGSYRRRASLEASRQFYASESLAPSGARWKHWKLRRCAPHEGKAARIK